MTTEEIHNLNRHNEDTGIVKSFTYLNSVINSNENCSQEVKGRLRLGKGVMKELGKITKNKGMSLETKAQTIQTLIFPILLEHCQR